MAPAMWDCRRLVLRRRRRPGMTGATASSSSAQEWVEAPVCEPVEAPAWLPAAEVAVLSAVEAALVAAVVRVLVGFAPRSSLYLESLPPLLDTGGGGAGAVFLRSGLMVAERCIRGWGGT